LKGRKARKTEATQEHVSFELMSRYSSERLGNTTDTQDYWVFWIFPSSGILETRKHDISETDPVS
jgi:hypothetical protein